MSFPLEAVKSSSSLCAWFYDRDIFRLKLAQSRLQTLYNVHVSSDGTMASSKGADASTVPVLKDLTIENITENVHRINSQCADPRLKYVMERLVSHLHDFARETRLSFDEWMAGIQFLTQVGQICTDVRQVSFHLILVVQDQDTRAVLIRRRNSSFFQTLSASLSS